MTTERRMNVLKPNSRNTPSGFVLSAATVSLAVSSTLAFAADTLHVATDFDIPPQAIESALHEFSKQADVQVMVMSWSVAGQRTSGVKGHLNATSALAQLLQNTNLTYETVGENTVTVKPIAAVKGIALQQAAPEQKGLQKGDDAGARHSNARDLDSNRRAPQKEVEEVIVTAQKRAERLQDVPISISVVSGATLDKSTAQGVTEMLSRVPGTAVNVTAQGGATQVVMRGVAAGDALFSGSSPVSYYLDSAPFGFVRQAIAPDTNAYDLQRVEVLRGPQGTLYGASAQNGVVRVLTHDADLKAFDLKARTSASATEHGGENYRGDFAVNVPIVEDKLAARAVIGYQDSSGWIDRSNKKDVNDAEIGNFRLKVNAQPTEQLSIGLSAWLSRSDYGGPSTSNDDLRQVAVLDEPIETDFDTYGLKIGYNTDAVAISAMSSYLEYSNDNIRDYIYFGPDLREQDTFKAHMFSQEVLLNSRQDGAWRWSLGGMYRDAKDLQLQVLLSGGVVSPLAIQTYVSESFAVFGELTRQFLDGKLELTGGLRYFEDDVTSQDDLRNVAGGDKFDAVSPRVVLTWHPNDDLTTYVSYAEGFRSGFPQSGYLLANAPGFPPLDPDTLHNYEVGAKGTLWEGRFSFDSALYYIDWQDVQQSLTVPVTSGGGILATALINSESASGIGFDLGMTARPLDGVELGVSFSWNDLAMDADVVSQGIVLFNAGDRLNLSPEYVAGAWANYNFALGSSGFDGLFSLSANYTSEMDLRTIAFDVLSIAPGDPMLIARASFAVEAPKNWTATFFIDNLTNEEGSPVRFPFAPGIVNDWDSRVRPRTIGAQLEYHF